MEARYLQQTELLDYEHPSVRALIDARGWRELEVRERIAAIYSYCRDEIPLGYNLSDDIPASAVLADGYGQCNTKSVLLMALLRAVGVPCRVHGATVEKQLQQGVVDGLFYRLAPTSIVHSWAEVCFEGRWSGLEGVVVDSEYLAGLRSEFSLGGGAFQGYAVGTENIAAPDIEWDGTDTAIQATGIDRDYGVFDDPDSFYSEVGANLSGPKRLLYRYVVRHVMNRRVAQIRSCGPEAKCSLDGSGSVEPAEPAAVS